MNFNKLLIRKRNKNLEERTPAESLKLITNSEEYFQKISYQEIDGNLNKRKPEIEQRLFCNTNEIDEFYIFIQSIYDRSFYLNPYYHSSFTTENSWLSEVNEEMSPYFGPPGNNAHNNGIDSYFYSFLRNHTVIPNLTTDIIILEKLCKSQTEKKTPESDHWFFILFRFMGRKRRKKRGRVQRRKSGWI